VARTPPNHRRSNVRVERHERYAGYGVYDPLGQKIGRVERLFINEYREPEYVRVKMRLFGTKSVLIPVRFAEIDEDLRILTLK
jgi:hypothetical protein